MEGVEGLDGGEGGGGEVYSCRTMRTKPEKGWNLGIASMYVGILQFPSFSLAIVRINPITGFRSRIFAGMAIPIRFAANFHAFHFTGLLVRI